MYFGNSCLAMPHLAHMVFAVVVFFVFCTACLALVGLCIFLSCGSGEGAGGDHLLVRMEGKQQPLAAHRSRRGLEVGKGACSCVRPSSIVLLAVIGLPFRPAAHQHRK
jgi:hypothetical protein